MQKLATTIEASTAFRKAYDKLQPVLRERVDRTVEKLLAGPTLPGLSVEKVQGASDYVRSCRVTRGIRLIYEIVDSTIRLLYVGDHDVAYRKAVFYFIVPHLLEQEVPAEDLGRFTMFRPERIHTEEMYEELTTMVHEIDVSPNVVRVIVELIEQVVADGMDGRARPVFPVQAQAGGAINVIPSELEGPCRAVLVAFCFDGDSFNERLREVAYHAGIHCPETKLIVLVTSRWNPREWKRNHEEAFANLRAKLAVFFVGFGKLSRIG
jgi:mRNA-degrading endonuclease RelE of RelBE toxin-antitoxin system